MDEETERLRDLFVDVAGEEEVTERQTEERGSLVRDRDVASDLRETIETMRERYDFRTSLSTDDLATVVRGFYDERSDAEIARDLGVDRETVARARIDLHLITDGDREAPFDLDELREATREEVPLGDLADDLGAGESTVRRYLHVLEADEERRLAADRFREEFERLLGDADLAERLTDDVKESGLEEAAEDIETNVSF